MKKWFGPIGIIVLMLIVFALVLIPKYNSLVAAEENVDSKWAMLILLRSKLLRMIP